jgi:hypothetical protein
MQGREAGKGVAVGKLSDFHRILARETIRAYISIDWGCCERVTILESGGKMAGTITEILYDWLHKRRLVTAVAERMGINPITLSAELRPTNGQAKLGADELVPLFDAIRALGYGRELRGIVQRFIAELKGKDWLTIPDDQLEPLIVQLTRGLAFFSEFAVRVPSQTDERELVRMRTLLRTEIVPAIMRLEDTIERSLAHVRGRQRIGREINPEYSS